MANFSVRVKSKTGQHVISNLTDVDTISNLKIRIAQLTSISQEKINILTGFPPKTLVISSNSQTLKSVGIKNGETLIVDEKNSDITPQIISGTMENDIRIAEELNSSNGILMKKVVPADNSCLFTSIGYVLNGTIDLGSGSFMREVIAKHVENDKETYNEAILGRPNVEYCIWIQEIDSWGGAIEVSILSSFFGVEIDVVDIQNAIIIRFGEDKNYGMRVFLLFDGIHYDPLYLESVSGGAPRTLFPSEEEDVYKQAEQLAQEAKSSRQFTNVDKFKLKCYQCDVLLSGQVQAQSHAKTTGHTNFGEI